MYCSITNHKFSNLKHCAFIILDLHRYLTVQKSRHGPPGFPDQHSVHVTEGLSSYQETPLRLVHLLASSESWQSLFPCRGGREVPVLCGLSARHCFKLLVMHAGSALSQRWRISCQTPSHTESLSLGKFCSLLRAHLIRSESPGIILFPKSRLILDFNYMCKLPSQQHVRVVLIK